MRPAFPFPQIATGDLDIAVVGQLPPPKFPLRDEFEPGSVKVVRFEAAFRRGGLWKQGLEHAPRYANDAFILAHADAELDNGALRIPPGVGRKAEEHGPLGVLLMFCTNISQMRQSVAFGGTASRLRRQTPGSRAGQGSQSRLEAWAVGSTGSATNIVDERTHQPGVLRSETAIISPVVLKNTGSSALSKWCRLPPDVRRR
jgi:hypothetical protein